jgi:hypothetical protein
MILKNMPNYMDMYVETEEFITSGEYLRRREAGEINPLDVRIAPPKFGDLSSTGFYVKLKTPRYKSPLGGINFG